ncbi:MAG: hypothetical protein ACYDEB_10810 [Dehalococcoidia bacterium]
MLRTGPAPAFSRAVALPPYARAVAVASRLRLPARVLASLALVAAGVFGAQFVRDARRWQPADAIPYDFPLPPQAHVMSSRFGETLVYHADLRTPEPPGAVRAYYAAVLPRAPWRLFGGDAAGDTLSVIRRNGAGTPDFVVKVRIAPEGPGSRIALDYSPLPVARTVRGQR